MIETDTITEALYYLLKKLGSANKLKLIKLVYLADKYHLIRYGRTITNDDYYAMEYGPVGSTVRDVLSSLSENKYAARIIKQDGDHDYEANASARVSFDMLSETDREALDFVIGHFGKKSSSTLVKYTHKYPEWLRHEALLAGKHKKRMRIETKELLTTIENDPLAMSEEHMRESMRILTGDFR